MTFASPRSKFKKCLETYSYSAKKITVSPLKYAISYIVKIPHIFAFKPKSEMHIITFSLKSRNFVFYASYMIATDSLAGLVLYNWGFDGRFCLRILSN